jgi:MOSC N-terminal beta barrel domain
MWLCLSRVSRKRSSNSALSGVASDSVDGITCSGRAAAFDLRSRLIRIRSASGLVAVALGSVVSLWRYPVKSMMGEELNATDVMEHGVLGDRAYALVDTSDGKAATAKNPRKWPGLFDFRATFAEPVRPGARVPSVRILLPDGTTVTSDQGDLNQILSKALNREVRLRAAQHGAVTAEEYWPDLEGLDHRDTVTDFTLPEGTFFETLAWSIC